MHLKRPVLPHDQCGTPHFLAEIKSRNANVVILCPVVADPFGEGLYFVVISGQCGVQHSVTIDHFTYTEEDLVQMRLDLINALSHDRHVHMICPDDEVFAARVAASYWPDFQPMVDVMTRELERRRMHATMH